VTSPRFHIASGGITLLLFVSCAAVDAAAACSESQVQALSAEGRTVKNIAKACRMSASEVREILAESDSEPDPPDSSGSSTGGGHSSGAGKPSGTPLSNCGCWGPVTPGYQEPSPICQSGFAVAVACPMMCQMGGYAWRGVCG
jgi:hypothetical protein